MRDFAAVRQKRSVRQVCGMACHSQMRSVRASGKMRSVSGHCQVPAVRGIS